MSKKSDRMKGHGARAPFVILLCACVCLLITLIVVLVLLLRDLSYLTGDGRTHYGLRAAESRGQTDAGAEDVSISQAGQAVSGAHSAATVKEHYILIGDSRTRGMNLATNLSASASFDVIAESNMGYHWLMSTALPEASRIDCDNYVSLLGINDLAMIDSYLAAYRDLVTQGRHLTLVTVGPVDEEYGQYAVTNAEICAFNDRLYEVDGAKVLDLYTYMTREGYRTMDGVHYDDDSYGLIGTFLLTQLE